jgi:hypothetical protein
MLSEHTCLRRNLAIGVLYEPFCFQRRQDQDAPVGTLAPRQNSLPGKDSAAALRSTWFELTWLQDRGCREEE